MVSKSKEIRSNGESTDNTANDWARLFDENNRQDTVPEEDGTQASVIEDDEMVYPGMEDHGTQGSVIEQSSLEEPKTYSDDATEALQEVHTENDSASFKREKDSVDLLHEAYEDYDPKTMDSLEAAEKDVKEGFWRKIGKAARKAGDFALKILSGKENVSNNTERKEARREIAGKFGKKVFEVAKKLVEAGATAATQTVMNSMKMGI